MGRFSSRESTGQKGEMNESGHEALQSRVSGPVLAGAKASIFEACIPISGDIERREWLGAAAPRERL